MAVKSKTTLKNDANSAVYDNNNREIEAAQHNDLLIDIIDSTFNAISNASGVGLKEHDSNTSYSTGDTVLYNHSIWIANKSTSGAFTEADWNLVIGSQIRFVSSDYVMDSKGDRFVVVDSSGGASRQITLPAAQTNWSPNRVITIVNFNNGNGNTDIRPSGSDTVNGGSNLFLDQDYGRIDLIDEGNGNWAPLSVWDLNQELSFLTASEIQQIQNIGGKTISNTQWGYVGNMDQHVDTSADVRHQTIRSERREGEWNDTTISSNTNDLSVNGQFFLRMQLDGANYDLTGVANEADGIELVVYNADSTYTLSLPHESTNSASSNQFWNSSSANTVSLPPRAMARYRYDFNYLGEWVLESISPEASLV